MITIPPKIKLFLVIRILELYILFQFFESKHMRTVNAVKFHHPYIRVPSQSFDRPFFSEEFVMPPEMAVFAFDHSFSFKGTAVYQGGAILVFYGKNKVLFLVCARSVRGVHVRQ